MNSKHLGRVEGRRGGLRTTQECKKSTYKGAYLLRRACRPYENELKYTQHQASRDLHTPPTKSAQVSNHAQTLSRGKMQNETSQVLLGLNILSKSQLATFVAFARSGGEARKLVKGGRIARAGVSSMCYEKEKRARGNCCTAPLSPLLSNLSLTLARC